MGALLPDGYSQIFRSYVFGPSGSGLWLRYATLQNLIPSFPWSYSPEARRAKQIQSKNLAIAIWQPCLDIERDL